MTPERCPKCGEPIVWIADHRIGHPPHRGGCINPDCRRPTKPERDLEALRDAVRLYALEVEVDGNYKRAFRAMMRLIPHKGLIPEKAGEEKKP